MPERCIRADGDGRKVEGAVEIANVLEECRSVARVTHVKESSLTPDYSKRVPE